MLAFQDEPAFVIHKRSYNDHSDLVQILTPGYGRVTVITRSSVRMIGKVLQPFIPASVSCGGRGEIPSLRQFEPEGVQVLTTAEQRIVGMYVNELLTKLTPLRSASRTLFQLYAACIGDIGNRSDMRAGMVALEKTLRNFELDLLELVGNGLQLQYESDSMRSLKPDAYYRYDADRGAVRIDRGDACRFVYTGATLIAARRRFGECDCSVMAEAKQLLRQVIDHHLGGKMIETRTLFSYLQNLT